MRNPIIKLNELYGNENNQALTVWFNKQVIRISIFNNGAVSLMDVDESKILTAITRLNACIPMTAKQFVEYTELHAVMNQSQLDFEPVFRFNSNFYRFLLEASGSVLINAFSLVREQDKFERYGHDKHVVHIPNESKNDAPIIMAYVNGSASLLDVEFSVVLNKNEIEGVKENLIKNAFNGANPYSEIEWEDAYLSAVTERLYDEDVFSGIAGELGEDVLSLFKAVKLYNEDRFQNKTLNKLKVYSDYGKHIATKKFRFSGVDKMEQKRKKVELTLVCNKGASQNHDTNNDTPDFDDVVSDFGGF